ncbi:MAG: hypothetical protein ABIH46_06545 [Chloroflexota bacterium]
MDETTVIGEVVAFLTHDGFCALRGVTGLPPTLNQSYHSYPTGGRCQIVLADEAREYKDFLGMLVRSALNECGVPFPTDGKYSLAITQRLNRNSRDADANVKLVMDAVCQGLGINDNKVYQIYLVKEVRKGHLPHLEFQLRQLP